MCTCICASTFRNLNTVAFLNVIFAIADHELERIKRLERISKHVAPSIQNDNGIDNVPQLSTVPPQIPVHHVPRGNIPHHIHPLAQKVATKSSTLDSSQLALKLLFLFSKY
jgi:hypothetical protein